MSMSYVLCLVSYDGDFFYLLISVLVEDDWALVVMGGWVVVVWDLLPQRGSNRQHPEQETGGRDV